MQPNATASPQPPEDWAFSQRVFRVLFSLAREHKRQFFLVTLFSFLYTGADLIQPLIYRHAINDVAGLFVQQNEPPRVGPAEPHRTGYIAPRTGEETIRTLLISVALLFVTSVVSYFFFLRANLFGVRVAYKMESSLIVRTFGHVLRLPLSFFSNQASAGLAKRINQSDEVAPIIQAFAQEIAPEFIRLIGICAIMLRQNWEMALITVSMLPFYLLLARRSAVRMKSNLNPYYELWENISAHIADTISAVKTVKLSGAESREEDRLMRSSQYANTVMFDRVATAQRFHFSQAVLSHLSKAMVLGYGGWLVFRHRLTPGDVVMFVAYLERIYSPIDALNNIAVTLQQNFASLLRAVRLIETGPTEAGGTELAPGPGRIEFRDVHFSYVPGREVLRGLNITLEPGKITVIAGPSGAGKTTSVDLLLKLFERDSGEIYIDGQPLSRLGPSAVRAAIGVVAADGAVFRGTLADNVRYKRPTATTDEMLRAVLSAGLSRALERLPQGLTTEIGEHGVGLSAGERQRLQIARILVDKPRLLVLDEATANLDYATEMEVKQALTELDPRPTMLVIAHRYTMMKDADYVYVMKEGSVVEHGRPADLIAAAGWFAELARQSGDPASLAPLPLAPRPAAYDDDGEE
jgi:ABC-type multidrug transport system fused ATPase/permease subunit